uniref:Uncharacterized protein n=1 Tax=Nelumbo nucifera TaxID=4432 RepID=A0A822Z543_NELNU|nr:TPA_asm: hypothetical protein HUJ06_013143 [Nelumbo nucifera]
MIYSGGDVFMNQNVGGDLLSLNEIQLLVKDLVYNVVGEVYYKKPNANLDNGNVMRIFRRNVGFMRVDHVDELDYCANDDFDFGYEFKADYGFDLEDNPNYELKCEEEDDLEVDYDDKECNDATRCQIHIHNVGAIIGLGILSNYEYLEELESLHGSNEEGRH